MQIQGWFEDVELVNIAMEHFQYGDLQNHMNQNWSEVQVKNVASQLLDASCIGSSPRNHHSQRCIDLHHTVGARQIYR